MGKHRPKLEWRVVENDTEWEQIAEHPRPGLPTAANSRLSYKYYGWLAASLLLLWLASAKGWGAGSSAAPQLAPKVTATAQPKALAPGRTLFATSIISAVQAILDSRTVTAAVSATWDVKVTKLELHSQYAVVSFVATARQSMAAYRQTLFYQRQGTAWQPATPLATLWGPEGHLETPFFVYHFRQHDAAIISTVAPQVDGLYRTLATDLGLPTTTPAKKLLIDINVTQAPGSAPAQRAITDHFSVAAPALYAAPIEITEEQLLTQWIALPLFDHLLRQASAQYQISAAWRPLRQGLALWWVWDSALPLAVWRQEIVQWLYQAAPTTASNQFVRLPARYAALCAAHTLWLASPSQIGIPFQCTGPNQQGIDSSWLQFVPPTHLAQLAIPILPHTYSEPERTTDLVTYPGQTVVLATLIEYAVATYGRERLPALVAGWGQYTTWETLIPAVYGVSPSEFEAGWQSYLVTHYGLDPATIGQ